MSEIKKSIEIGGKTLSISTGKLAGQANSAVLASIGDTVVLATVVSSKPIADLGYFPLTVEYQERLYAGGRIKGSRWVKREGRPTDEEILSARLIDRSIRPLFPKSYKNEVQVIVTVLSVDLENSPDIVGAIAVSAALTSSSIPWQGPISIMRVALSDKDFVAFPSTLEIAASKLDLVVSSNKDAVIMIEAGAKEVSEEIILDGISFAQKEGEKLLNLINGLAQAVGNKKDELSKGGHDDKIRKQIEKLAKDKIADLIKKTSMKKAGVKEYEEIKSATVASFEREEMAHAANEFENLFKEIGREMIIAGTRPDGRKYDEIRALSAEVGVLPRTHGSAIFQRGETQVLAITTLGSQAMEQLIETAEGEESKRYMHHYAMPPYASGETGKVGFPSRREIGHGALAERALIPVIP
ncbi:MAG: polyribonucleotide nucleotidyltransferase, partial [Patescibacteria group bacterium]